MILLAEPTYADVEYAAVNGAIQQACGPVLEILQRRFGRIGHVCPDLEAIACADRLPQSLARTVRQGLSC